MIKVQQTRKLFPFIRNFSKEKINPDSLGLICKDGTINFASADAAHSYAKTRVIQSLLGDTPHERGIYLYRNKILKEFEGNFESVSMPTDNMPKDTICVHSHSYYNYNGKIISSNISNGDYKAMMLSPIEVECIAYDIEGNYSSIKKTGKVNATAKELGLGMLDVILDGLRDGFNNVVLKPILKLYSLINIPGAEQMYKQLQISRIQRSKINRVVKIEEDFKSKGEAMQKFKEYEKQFLKKPYIRKNVLITREEIEMERTKEKQEKYIYEELCYEAYKEMLQRSEYFWKKYGKKYGVEYSSTMNYD